MLKVKDLTIQYKNVTPPIQAVDNISFELEKGEALGIIGESGSGKSSIALSLMGLLTQAQITGEISFQGKELTHLSHHQWRSIRWRKIAIVFQNSLEALNPVLTIGEQISEPIKNHLKASQLKIDQQVDDLLTQVGLPLELKTYYPHQISGGMRQRVLIAMAISCQPDLLIFDEPTTSLDSETSHDILFLIERLQKMFRFGMVIISHHLQTIKRLTDQVITLYAGQIIEKGPTKAVLNNPMHCYTRGLINASPDFYIYKDLWGISGEPPTEHHGQSGCVFYSRCCQKEISCQNKKPLLEEIKPKRFVACHKGGIETFLSAKDIWKTYDHKGKRISAVEGVSLDIKSGEIVALVGKSGSGKSTLAQILINGLEKDQGSVLFRNKEMLGRDATSCMEGLQMVYQDPFSSIHGRMSSIDVVCEPLNIMRWQTKTQRKERAIQMMTRLQLPVTPDFLNRPADSLSGGQRQRLAIARSLVTHPKLLIADEITSMLDPSTQANIIRGLKQIQNQYGFAMLYITHDLFMARKIADKILVMSNGKIVESGNAIDVFEHPSHKMTQSLVQAFNQEYSLLRN